MANWNEPATGLEQLSFQRASKFQPIKASEAQALSKERQDTFFLSASGQGSAYLL